MPHSVFAVCWAWQSLKLEHAHSRQWESVYHCWFIDVVDGIEKINLDLQLPEDEENPPQVFPIPGSDIYSFGGIMLQVLTGKVPYHYYSCDE
ncbi:hypothetical protein PAXINDRAFT_17667 [Paxillus involutus ATCC 200175]|uniref:Protein kinase domain-containing protein n=1 Tax=Paxillus involutus ATCC 200175 TaxID=664439 RepID=A0A0C9T0N7_PAXIN|nr:hypothetical protein PAXINDRAFT_17667 [Paxillus involutus ATCC 200175]